MAKRIVINNEARETEAQFIQQLAAELDLPERGVALAVNNKIVPRATWPDTAISEGDSITIIKAAFGG
ncbi:MAG: sulfur carrier protein ThiS [Bacteroidales bacterium]|nr:sulfur carrier protein ThiS [Candidatus Liminaster caballi]